MLPTAHDMSREYRVLSALAGTDVPVARPLAYCADEDIVGAPFYLMEYVPGVVLRSRQDTAALTEQQTRTCPNGWPTCSPRSTASTSMPSACPASAAAPDTSPASLRAGSGSGNCPTDREVPGYDDLVARLTATLPPEGETTWCTGTSGWTTCS